MPQKSRRSKLLQYQRKQERQQVLSTGGKAPETTPPVKAVTPPPAAPAPRKTVAGLRYPYVAAELRRIGLLAGIIMVVLIVLALVLS
jgi:hypothetical protein